MSVEKALDKAIKVCDELNLYAITYYPSKDPKSLPNFAYSPGANENEAINNLKKKYSVASVRNIKKASKNSKEYKQMVSIATGKNKFD